MTRYALALLLLAAAPGCHRHANAPAAAPPSEARNAAGGIGAGTGTGTGAAGDDDDDDTAPGERKRFREGTVFIDGVPTIAFTYNEMPPGVKVFQKEWDEGEFYSHFLICDYLKNLGVDCKDVKETHWYAGRNRIAIITGAELRKYRDRLYFNFTRELYGKPRVEWGHDIHTNDSVDKVSDLAVYVHKKPPRWDRKEWTLIADDGAPIDGIPYLKEEMRGGLRVNLDGRQVARIKRNLLEGNLTPVDEQGGTPRYSLRAFLESKGQKLDAFTGIDLLTHDDRVIRLDRELANAHVLFSAPKDNHGEMMAYFGEHFAPVQAINVYARLAPPTRKMRTLTIRGGDTAGGVSTSQGGGQKTQGRR